MPMHKIRDYFFSGVAKVKIYSQAEMARALGVSEVRLVTLLESGEVGLSYHLHPMASGGGGYEFGQASYDSNIKVWRCHKSNSHDYRNDPSYSHLPGGAKTCSRCGRTIYG